MEPGFLYGLREWLWRVVNGSEPRTEREDFVEVIHEERTEEMDVTGAKQARFEVGERARVELRLPEGQAVFLTGENGKVEAEVRGRHAEDFIMEQLGERVLLQAPRGVPGMRWASFDVEVRVPEGTSLDARVASADVEVEVELGELRANFASGDLQVESVVENASVKTASGDVEIGDVAGRLEVSAASGDIHVGSVEGAASLSSTSGDVRVGSAAGRLNAKSTSGDVEIEDYLGEDLECRTVSGEVRISLPTGKSYEVDLGTLSGSIRNEFSVGEEDGAGARLRVNTVSGDIILAGS